MTAVLEEIQSRVAKKRAEETELRKHLLQLAQSGIELGREEKQFFESCGWDERRLSREYKTARTALRNLQIAGRDADRQALAKQAEQADKKLATEGEKLREQIAAAEKKLADLETEAKRNNKRLAEAQQAVETLEAEASLPDFIRDQIRTATAIVDDSLTSRILSLQTDVREAEYLAKEPPTGTPEKDRQYQFWLEALRRHHPQFVEEVAIRQDAQPVGWRSAGRPVMASSERQGLRTTVVYRNAQKQLLAEAAEKQEQIDDLKAERDAELAKINGLRRFWIELAHGENS